MKITEVTGYKVLLAVAVFAKPSSGRLLGFVKALGQFGPEPVLVNLGLSLFKPYYVIVICAPYQ